MSETNEQNYVGDLVKYETPLQFCRIATVIPQNIAETTDWSVGQVLDGVTDTPSVPVKEASTGSDVDGVLLTNVSAEEIVAGDVPVVCLVRGPAVIDSDQLVVVAGIKAAAITALAALHIISRTEPTYDTQTT